MLNSVAYSPAHRPALNNRLRVVNDKFTSLRGRARDRQIVNQTGDYTHWPPDKSAAPTMNVMAMLRHQLLRYRHLTGFH